MTDEGIFTNYLGERMESYGSNKWKIPNVLSYIQSKTELTRFTIKEILLNSGRISDMLMNPQLFLDQASIAINRVLYELMIDGIKYEKIGEKEYEMTLFEAQELEVYLNDFTFKVSDNLKTIYEEFVPLDSGVENQFANDCETSEQVKFYFKLPSWFRIPTPIGKYNPDWAVVLEGDNKIYFVAETKDTGGEFVDISKIGSSERYKIKCGKAHFKEIDNLEYKVVKRVSELK